MISPRALAASAVAGLVTLAVGLAAAGVAVAIVAGVACALAVALLVQPALARQAGVAQGGGEAVEAAADARLEGFRASLRLERAGLDGAVRAVVDAREDAERAADAARLLGEATGRGGASSSAVAGAETRLGALLTSSGRLDELAAAVAELAGQLGILSLNATIEEARRPTARGTRGGAASPSRTTGVLIDELCSLAERVSAVSGQIGEHAVALRDETRTVATSVGEARASLGSGETARAEAGDALGAEARLDA